MWGLGKWVGSVDQKSNDDFIKEQIQRKLQGYISSQGPSQFCGLATAHGLVVEFEYDAAESLRLLDMKI